MTTENGLAKIGHVKANLDELRREFDALLARLLVLHWSGQAHRSPAWLARARAMAWALPVLEHEYLGLLRVRRLVAETENRPDQVALMDERLAEAAR